MLRWIVGTGRKPGTANHGATARTKEEKHEGEEKEGGVEVQLMEEEEEKDVQEEGSEEENGEPNSEEIVEEESWVDWIRRATEGHLRRLKIEDWVTRSRALKWRWTGHVARRIDERWSTAAVLWQPQGGGRKVGYPRARWKDDLEWFT